MLKDGNLQVSWDEGELIIDFSNEVDEDGYSDDQYIIDEESAYCLFKFLAKKFQKRLLGEAAKPSTRLKIGKSKK